ncbi:MAG: DUF3536 domain-containing protein [Cyanobacteria bacterium P01_A01_bin.135]
MTSSPDSSAPLLDSQHNGLPKQSAGGPLHSHSTSVQAQLDQLVGNQAPGLGAATLATPQSPDRNQPSGHAPIDQSVYVTVHGHFYQPPRENPYLDAIERQPSAAPFHDWNERIHYECYRPNAFARILNHQGEVMEIVNTFEYLSFNIGPTLMRWMERHDVEAYQRIIEADHRSCDRLDGHGNAIAQVYNHIILPLANDRDKRTQIRWGMADFKARFGRDPEGMWLAETAVDYATLRVLAEEGIRFIILAPSQAQRCRPLPTEHERHPDWVEVGGGQIDPVQPYRCYISAEPESGPEGGDSLGPSDHRPYVDIFFYDGPISRDMGFNDVMDSSQHFAGRIAQAVRGDHRQSQLISVATDGETFGHHKGGAEKALAYAVTHTFPERGWQVTNYAHYLSLHPPTWEVELKPVTAWSCSHGVDRWQDDCGCGGGGGWNQKWRRPLRDSLNWLRDQLAPIYEEMGAQLFRDPWEARDHYIHVLHDGARPVLESDRAAPPLDQFFAQHQTHTLGELERVDALRLLEMQRHALLMYTSCGWFFDELSRPEGTQILRYAARAIELAGEVAGVQLEQDFVTRLTAAPSNLDCFEHGGEVYRQLVNPSRISLGQVAAHYAISSLFSHYDPTQQLYCYEAHRIDYQRQRIGPLTLAVGQLQLTFETTQEKAHLVFAVLHLGGWDFHCCITPFTGRLDYAKAKAELFDTLGQASIAQLIVAINRLFGEQSYSLQDLFAEERHRIMRLLSQETLQRLDQLYSQTYRDNYSILAAFHRDGLAVPQELQVAAEIALNHRAMAVIRQIEQTASLGGNALTAATAAIAELEAIAVEAGQLHCSLQLTEGKAILQRLVLQSLRQLLDAFQAETANAEIQWLQRLIEAGDRLNLGLSLDRAQELYLRSIQERVVPQLLAQPVEQRLASLQALKQLLRLGKRLAVDVDHLLELS